MNIGSKQKEILYLYSQGLKQVDIAKRLNITQPAVSLCLKRKNIKIKIKSIFEIEEKIIELKSKRDKHEIGNHSHFLCVGMINALEWVLSDTKKEKKK